MMVFKKWLPATRTRTVTVRSHSAAQAWAGRKPGLGPTAPPSFKFNLKAGTGSLSHAASRLSPPELGLGVGQRQPPRP